MCVCVCVFYTFHNKYIYVHKRSPVDYIPKLNISFQHIIYIFIIQMYVQILTHTLPHALPLTFPPGSRIRFSPLRIESNLTSITTRAEVLTSSLWLRGCWFTCKKITKILMIKPSIADHALLVTRTSTAQNVAKLQGNIYIKNIASHKP